MKLIKVTKIANYCHHGIGYTEHDGYAGTSDNSLSIKRAIIIETYSIKAGEQYQICVNGKNDGRIYTK